MFMAAGWVELVLMVVTLGGGPAGLLPVSLPPQPIDNELLALAPEECFIGYAMMGRAEIGDGPASEFEKLMKEPAVGKFQRIALRELENWLVQAASRGGADASNQQLLRRIIAQVRQAIDSPLLLYFDFEVNGQFAPPNPKAGLVMKLGKREASEALELVQMLLQATGAPLEKVALAGDVTGIRLVAGPGALFEFAVADDLLVATIGVGEGRRLLARRGGKPNAMFTRIQQDLTIERPNTIGFIDIHHALKQLQSVAPLPVAAIYEAAGVDNLMAIETISGLHGRQFLTKQRIRFEGAIHGLMDKFGRRPLGAADLRTVPADALAIHALRVDPLEIFRGIKEMAAAVAPQAEVELQDGLGRLHEETGIDLEKHVLKALNGDLQFVLMNVADPPSRVAGRITGSVRDSSAARELAKTIADLVEQSLADAPGAASIRRSKHRGADVYELIVDVPGAPRFLKSVAWSVNDEFFVVASGKDHVTSFLDSPVESPHAASIPAIQTELRKKPFALVYMDSRTAVEQGLPALSGSLQLLAASGLGPRLDPAIVPPADQVVPHMLPTVASLSRRDDGFYVETSQTMPLLNMTPMTGVFVALVLPAIQSARQSARNAKSSNNLKQLMLALHNYHEDYNGFPPAYSVDKDGKPLLSWRVLILPYLDEMELYERFRLDEPWDSEHNKRLLDEMPDVFRSPASAAKPNETTYLAIRMKGAVMEAPSNDEAKKAAAKGRGIRLQDITDGSSNTVVLVEVGSKSAIPWTKPVDLTVDSKDPRAALSSPYPGEILAAFADGSISRLKMSLGKDTWLRLFQRSDGEPVDRDEIQR